MTTLLKAKDVTRIYDKAQQPSILFADESTGALDSNSATELLNTLQEANEESKKELFLF